MHLRNLEHVTRWTGEQRRQIYEQLAAINAGFEATRRGLNTFVKLPGFERTELNRLGELAAETRAATLSYLANIIETVETDDAGRLQNRRFRKERRAE